MRAVLQRVRSGQVEVDGRAVAQIGRGLLVYLGVAHGDDEEQAKWTAEKVANLRIFEDQQGKLNLSVRDCGGAVLVVPNFTLLADARKGRRPSLAKAAPAEAGRAIYERFVAILGDLGCPVSAGMFGARMIIRSVADGPVNIILDVPPDAAPGGSAPEEA